MGGAPAAVTCAVYTQSVPDLERVYGRDETRAILSNCAHQVWFPPRDAETARVLADLLGQRLVVERGASRGAQERTHGGGGESGGATRTLRHRPFLEPTQAMALPAGTVACLSGPLRFLAADSRAALAGALPRLPPPPAPEAPGESEAIEARAPLEADDTARWAALLGQLDDAPEVVPPDDVSDSPSAADALGDVAAPERPDGPHAPAEASAPGAPRPHRKAGPAGYW